MEKTVQTLGEMLAGQSRRLSRRYRPGVSWLGLLAPVTERNEARAAGGGRFERREAVPGPGPAGPVRPEQADAGEPVPAAVQDRLRPALGPGVDLARVHTDARADAFARAQEADAVTVGRDVYFRSGSFAPHTAPGLGLLAHELAHVAEGERPDAGRTRARPEGARQEEDRARAVEQRFARPPVSPLAAQTYAPPVPAAAPGPAVPVPAAAPGPGGDGGAPRPMRAAADRPAPDQAPAMPNLDRFRQRLFSDLMAQIRVEFERGS
jgi:hypothetical protein